VLADVFVHIGLWRSGCGFVAWSRWEALLDRQTYGDVDAIIGEDEGGVGSGELRVGHVVVVV